jgi:hypothetical protein
MSSSLTLSLPTDETVDMNNKQIIRERLAHAERDVLHADRMIERQPDLLSKLNNERHEVAAARGHLELLEKARALHVAARDQLRRELDETN